MKRLVVNALLFQIVWLICVQANDLWAFLATLVLLVIHGRYVVSDPREWWLILMVSLVGVVLESSVTSFDVIEFSGRVPLAEGYLAPPWMVCLWVAFATTLCHSLAWLSTKHWLALGLGLCVVPLSYYAGLKLSQSPTIEPIWLALLVEGLLWSVVLPLAGLFVRVLNSRREPA